MVRSLSGILVGFVITSVGRADDLKSLLSTHCYDCHSADVKSGQLDLTTLAMTPTDAKIAAMWVRIHDRVAAGEMPPKKAEPLAAADREKLLGLIAKPLIDTEMTRRETEGRATRRRMNRQEYEHTLRDLFDAPWLPLKSVLPEDATAHGYPTVGDALDISHVQMARYLEAAERALTAVVATGPKAPPTGPVRFYARDQSSFIRRMTYSAFNTAPERATFPVLGCAGQPDVRSGMAPMTVGKADPATRELEGVGLVQGAYEPVEPKFDRFKASHSGRYKLRFRALSVWVGPNGANANLKDPTKLSPKWFIPNLDDVKPGRRSEPVTIYSELPPRQLRRLGAFDVQPEAGTYELDVHLLAGETIRPDASRLFRSRPGDQRWQNPLAEADGQPGIVYRWMEVEGPLHETWPPAGHRLLFDNLPIEATKSGVTIRSENPNADAARLLARFTEKAYRRPVADAEKRRFLPLIESQLAAGAPFKEAMFAGYAAVLCSPEFLTLHASPGRLDNHALAQRLSFFLAGSAPDAALRASADRGELAKPDELRTHTQRLLDDPRSRRFVESFTDSWLDLRKLLDNSPDAGLYGEYYLDDELTDSALEESRLTFAELIRGNRPAREIVAADYAFVNERLARHYGLPAVEGIALRKVPLPADSIRGGFLTQASVLTVTANGTTTSPVVRGAWVLDRILGQTPPKPPPVPAVEPDLRGATTIREQLAKHRNQPSCHGCHAKIDPPGFALESFDVMGAERTKYRALAEKAERVAGFAKSGQPVQYKWGLPVDASGEFADGRRFAGIAEFKRLLLSDERIVARNFVNQLTVYATGAPVAFADRAAVEAILDAAKPDGYRIADLIHGLVQSDLMRRK
jgi:hypothetical protein